MFGPYARIGVYIALYAKRTNGVRCNHNIDNLSDISAFFKCQHSLLYSFTDCL